MSRRDVSVYTKAGRRGGSDRSLQLVSLRYMPANLKATLLKELGLNVDERGYVTRDGRVVRDKYIDQPVKLDNMMVLPGSTIVLDDNPLSIALYIQEYGDL